MKNKIIATLVALTMLGQVTLTASAISTSGGMGDSSAILNQEQTGFNVTVPTSLPITVDSAGVVTTSTDVKIHNNSYGPVTISDIQVDVANGWSIVDFNKDMSKSLVGLKEFGFIIQGDEVQSNGDVELTPASWESIPGNGSMQLTYDARVSPQKTALTDVNIANVVFILDWDEEIEPEEPSKYTLATDADFRGSKNGSFEYTGTNEYVEIPHVIKGVPVTSYKSMFFYKDVKGVKSTNKNVTDMNYMFRQSRSTELDLSSLDTSNVTDMSAMFYMSQVTKLDLSNFDTTNVTNMNSMFLNSQSTELDLSSFNTTNVTNMGSMFNGSQVTELDLSNFDTSNVTKMGNMFHTSKATKLNLSSFDTSSVTDMSAMFYKSLVTELDLSNFDTSNVTDMTSMFHYYPNTELDLSSFNTSKVTNTRSMFSNAKTIVGYAKTSEDAKKFNSSLYKPEGLTFTVKQ